MKNIDTAFRSVRRFAFLVTVCCSVITCLALYKSYLLVQRMQEKVYILANGKALEALAAERRDNIPVEARDHIRHFHESFFTLDPDENVIQDHVGKALYLADASAKKEYDNLREKGYYHNLIAANISQSLQVDSIVLDLDRSPFYFRCYATETLVRTTSTTLRKLVTEGWLRNISRSDHNPHGFLIEKWTILENRDLQNQKR